MSIIPAMVYLLLFSLLFLSKTVSAQTLIIQDDISQISVVPYITLLEDPDHTLTIEQVASPAYKDQFKAHTTEGYPLKAGQTGDLTATAVQLIEVLAVRIV